MTLVGLTGKQSDIKIKLQLYLKWFANFILE
jgi:hypothetical protein